MPPCRERRDTTYFDEAIERLVVMAEALVVGTVLRLVDVKECDDEPRALVVTTHATGCLDVLCVRLWLTEHYHQPETWDVETRGDHVRRDGPVHSLVFVEP